MLKEMQEVLDDIKAEAYVFETWMTSLNALLDGVQKRLKELKLGVKAMVPADEVDGDKGWLAWARPSIGDRSTWQLCFATGEATDVIDDERWVPLLSAPLQYRVASVSHLKELVEACLASLQALNGKLQTKLQSVLEEADALNEAGVQQKQEA